MEEHDSTDRRQVIRTEDLDDETLAAILAAQVSPKSVALNQFMDDTQEAAMPLASGG